MLTLKICKRCSIEKEVSEYRTRKNKYLQSYCIECSRDYDNERTAKAAKLINDFKDKPCADCGIRYPSYVMDFDHTLGNKLHNISRMRNHSIENLLIEIAKCDVVCANCHRIRTFS